MELQKLFGLLPMPVAICDTKNKEVLFMNTAAKSLLLIDNLSARSFADVFRCQSGKEGDWFLGSIVEHGFLRDFPLTVKNISGEEKGIVIRGSLIELSGKKFIAVYFEEDKKNRNKAQDLNHVLNKILYISSHTKNPAEALNLILETIGRFLDVSRTYVFEKDREGNASNTYEWCAEGVSSEKEALQSLSEDIFDWENITQINGMAMCDDVRTLADNDRMALERQGIKSLLVFNFYSKGEEVGFIGVDECRDYRKWKHWEMQLLDNASDIMATLILRQNAENALAKSYQIMRTIMDNIDAHVYVADHNEHKVLFANKSLKERLGYKNDEEIKSLDCLGPLLGTDSMCSMEPLAGLLDEEGNPSGILRREYYNAKSGLWYYTTSCAIEWIDGRHVQLENLVEFTERKKTEQELEHYASIDTLTGMYNRGWGNRLLRKTLQEAREDCHVVSLCFLDIDDLKKVNDQYGHIEGDNMLVRVAATIRKQVRASDILYRWGGDEFMLIMQHCALDKAAAIVQSIVDELKKEDKESNSLYPTSFSYGLVEVLPENHESFDEIMQKLDSKMYENKMQKE